jgi:SAM-dependent methyltransferase
LAGGYAERGAWVVALDLSPAMLRAAAGGRFGRVSARAEELPFHEAAFDAVVAGQAWHWFNGPAAARECRRVLRSGGKLIIAHFDYLALPGNVAAATEALILAHNPAWAWAGSDGTYERWRPHLESAGFTGVASFQYDEPVSYSHADWRGRIRACNGVLALRDPERIDRFDADHAALLRAEFPDPVEVPHRVFVIRGRAP